jgi:hypothetical protein
MTAESHDFNRKRILSFVTCAVSGLGNAVRDYSQSSPGGGQMGAGLAVRGGEASQHRIDVQGWLRQGGLMG